MKIDVTSFDGQKAGSIELSDDVFGLEPRKDLIFRMIRWQLAKRQAGTHKAKGRAEVWRTGKKMYKQKGTGGARHGSRRAAQFVGGAKAHGPVVRSHAFDLPKKVRALALRHALSSKARDGSLIVVDSLSLKEAKTAALREQLGAYEPYNTATAAYQAVIPLYRQGVGKSVIAAAKSPDGAARIAKALRPESPDGALALRDLLVTQSAAGGDPALGQAGDEGLDGLRRQRVAVPLETDQFLRQQRHGALVLR